MVDLDKSQGGNLSAGTHDGGENCAAMRIEVKMWEIRKTRVSG